MVTITVVVNHWLPRLIGVEAITLGRTIYCSGDSPAARLIVHECQHVRQWERLGRPRFLLKYLADYLRGRLQGHSHIDSYFGIGAEEEARAMAERYHNWSVWSDGERFPVVVVWR